jgi:hypothetical protein
MITWEYLAGFLDGEGSLKVYGGCPRVTVGQKHREVLDVIQEFLGTTNAITFSRNCYYLQYCHRGVVRHIVTNVYPFLIVKKHDAEIILSIWDAEARRT